ncbi:MAG TPA: hypothetical protein VGG61_03265 [Gemmataceae bacterium]
MPATDSAARGFREQMLGLVLLLGLMVWQGWMTLTLFGDAKPWQCLLDEQIILSGRHPLHLYHGYLGALSLKDHGSASCYDPSFQAGYPKTPIFDGGSRPAELFLLLAGASFRPAAYKVGLAICCLSVPLVLVLAGRSFGLRWTAACLAAGFGLLAWWGKPGRDMLETGDIDLLLAGLAALVEFGLLVRWNRHPGPLNWLGVWISASIGWYAHPLFTLLMLPLTLLYYLSVGGRHRFLWHVALVAALAGGMAVNSLWLFDWGRSWWLRNPLQTPEVVLSHRTFRTLWEAPFWGEPPDRALAVFLAVLAMIGVIWFNQERKRVSARLLGVASGTLLILATCSLVVEPLNRLGMSHLLIPALLFAALPAAHGLVEGVLAVSRSSAHPWRIAVCVALLLGVAAYAARDHVNSWLERGRGTTPLEIGLTEEKRALVTALADHTTPDARILWEDRPGKTGITSWTALLPLLTGRPFLGGLDPDADIEHAHARLTDQTLAGQALADWTDKSLGEFCQRYNVGWVVCWSPATVKRFREWSETKEAAILECDGQGVLFALPRPPNGFVLKGQAELLSADCERIALGNVRPAGDELVLSMHYQEGLRVSPRRVRIERELDPRDPIPFIRLRMSGPVTCITITWDKR